jgi:ribonuclease T2
MRRLTRPAISRCTAYGPTKKSCGIGYGFCGEVKKQQHDFCDYPELRLGTATRAALAQVMPSVVAGSCLGS